ncbi:MAG: hypothetical protein ABSG92_04530 [Conexivisphaerales archaeon]|jgi:predicted enzyme related to lactoylglutathione lyase
MSIVRFEIPSDDVRRAQRFYRRAYGWTISQYSGMDCFTKCTVPNDENGTLKSRGAINVGLAKRAGPT